MNGFKAFEIPFKLNKYGYHIDWNLKNKRS